MGSIAALIFSLLAESPELFADAETLITSVAHGEGGLAKVGAVMQNLSALAGHVATAVVTHPATGAPPVPAQDTTVSASGG